MCAVHIVCIPIPNGARHMNKRQNIHINWTELWIRPRRMQTNHKFVAYTKRFQRKAQTTDCNLATLTLIKTYQNDIWHETTQFWKKQLHQKKTARKRVFICGSFVVICRTLCHSHCFLYYCHEPTLCRSIFHSFSIHFLAFAHMRCCNDAVPLQSYNFIALWIWHYWIL